MRGEGTDGKYDRGVRAEGLYVYSCSLCQASTFGTIIIVWDL